MGLRRVPVGRERELVEVLAVSGLFQERHHIVLGREYRPSRVNGALAAMTAAFLRVPPVDLVEKAPVERLFGVRDWHHAGLATSDEA